MCGGDLPKCYDLILIVAAVVLVGFAFVKTSPRETELKACLTVSAFDLASFHAGDIDVVDKTIAAFESESEPAEYVDLHACGWLHHEHAVFGACQRNLAAPEIEVHDRVDRFIRNKCVAQFEGIPFEIKTLIFSTLPVKCIRYAVIAPADGEGFAELETEKAAPVEFIRVAVGSILVVVSAPDAGKSPPTFAKHGFFALGIGCGGKQEHGKGDQKQPVALHKNGSFDLFVKKYILDEADTRKVTGVAQRSLLLTHFNRN